ncbi:transmembrane and coiled-coil domain-containing protein 6 isoform X2 [Onychostruthus taczanowskii]|uniref:transmembrane and coiled-coil domain-containing protein 6 isoform X2 n=1 Tax=Onychostruthus taczanowskii TaxID=356909 RepID=UPI001B80B0C9|nr:transmembrane and coiled-coil domain-containing protein 6 isoform X2 [Onychostruthus taczanowskii]
MWGRRRGRRGGRSAEELRVRRREREAALRKARRQEQLVSKRLLREDSAAEEGAQHGADVVPDPLSEDEVLELLRGVQRGSEDRKRSLGRLRWALQNEETQQKFVRLDGSIRTLTGLFTSSLADLQLEAARCLHELSHSSVPAVAEACLPVTSYLLTYLSGHSLELTELCLYTLGNLVVESEAVRKQLLPQGIIPVLASCIQSPHEAVLEGVGYVLSQLLQAKEAPTEIIPLVLDSALPQHMLQLVCSGLKAGMGAAVEFAWCLHYIICRHKDNVQLLALGAVPALTSLLLDLASQIPQDAPEGLELVRGCQRPDARLLVALFLVLQRFLRQHPFLVQECLWLLNNLTADDPFFCSALLSLDLLPALLQLLTCSQMGTVLVLTVLCNMAEKGQFQCQRLLQQPLLAQLLPLLTLPDPEAVGQCLELLHLLFLHCPEAAADFTRQGGHRALEQHQSTPELQERAQALLDMVRQPPGAPSACQATLAASS